MLRSRQKWREQLDTIADGRVNGPKTLEQFYPPFEIALKEAPDKMYEARKAMEEESERSVKNVAEV